MQLHTLVLEALPGHHLDGGLACCRGPDVGWGVWPASCRERPLGRPAAYADIGYLWHCFRFSLRPVAGAGQAIKSAGRQGVVRFLFLTDPGRAADQSAVTVFRHAALFLA